MSALRLSSIALAIVLMLGGCKSSEPEPAPKPAASPAPSGAVVFTDGSGGGRSSQDHVRVGHEMRQAGDMVGAIEEYTSAILIDPYDGETYYWRGLSNGLQGRVKDGLSDLERAKEKGGGEAFAVKATTVLSEVEAARKSLRRSRMRELCLAAAEGKDLRVEAASASSAPPPGGSPQPHVDRAFRLSRSGDWEGVVDAYTQAIRLAPAHEPYYLNRGIAYTRIPQLDLAIEDFDRCLELNPGSPAALFLRGSARMAAGKLKEADQDLLAAIATWDRRAEREPENAEIYEQRGYVHAVRGDLHEAVADYKMALELYDPGTPGAVRTSGALRGAENSLMKQR